MPDAAMPRDTAGQLMSPWNLVQSVLADEVTLNFVKVKFYVAQDLNLFHFSWLKLYRNF